MEKLKKVGYANQSFYYGFSGEQSTIIQLVLTLKETVDPEILKKALKKAMKRFPNFQNTLVTKDNNIFYEKNDREPEIYPESNEQYYLATEQTNYFLFRVMYKDCRITIAHHHGLADGKASNDFGKTLLYYYLLLSGKEVAPSPSIKTEETPEDKTEQEYSFEKYASEETTPLWIYKNEKAFRIPEEYFTEEKAYCRKFKITCSITELLKIAKKYETTPVPVLSILISKVLHRLYEVGDQTIVGYIPVNLRPIYHSQAINNFSLAIPLPYRAKVKEKDLDIQATIQRGLMDIQIQKENFDHRLWKNCVSGKRVENIQAPVGMKQAGLIKTILENSRDRYSYLLTYVGKMDELPEDMKNYLAGAEFNLPSFIVPFSMTATTFGDEMNILCTQCFESNVIVKEFVKIMQEYGLEVHYEDRGNLYTDKLLLSKIKEATE